MGSARASTMPFAGFDASRSQLSAYATVVWWRSAEAMKGVLFSRFAGRLGRSGWPYVLVVVAGCSRFGQLPCPGS